MTRDLELEGAIRALGLEAAEEDIQALAAQMRSGDLDAALKTARTLSGPENCGARVLSSKILGLKGDKAAAFRELAEALKREPAAWIFLERSRLHEEMGDIPRALADVNSAIAADGGKAEFYLRRAHLQVCRRHYHLAVPDFSTALELEPGNVQALLGRGMVEAHRGDFTAALADLGLARKAAPGDLGVALEEARQRIAAGKLSGLLKELAAASARDEAAADFLKGCYWLKRRRCARACAEFESAMARTGDPGFGLKVGFHLALARGLRAGSGPKPAPKRGRARLYICGLGINPPYTASIETWRAIQACDFVFNNLSELEISGLLGLLAPACEPTMFDVRGADYRWTRAIFRKIKPGMTVGFVTRGHPLVCGGLAASLIQECRAVGADYRVFAAVSSMNTLAAQALPPEAQGFGGQQVLDYSSIFDEGFRLDLALPAVLYFNATVLELARERYDRFCSILEGLYGESHPCFFYGRSFSAAPEIMELRALREFHSKIDPSYTLLLGPVK